MKLKTKQVIQGIDVGTHITDSDRQMISEYLIFLTKWGIERGYDRRINIYPSDLSETVTAQAKEGSVLVANVRAADIESALILTAKQIYEFETKRDR